METFTPVYTASTASQSAAPLPQNNYSVFLDQYEVSYRLAGYQFVVGEVDESEGWMLHLSVVNYQMERLIETVVPVLIGSGIPFTIPYSLTAAMQIVDGQMGVEHQGKVLRIYPISENAAVSLARKLIPLTALFSGPVILADQLVQGIVFAKHGPLDYPRRKDIFGSSSTVQGAPTPSDKNVPWPFWEWSPPSTSTRKTILQSRFKVTETLKKDLRGNVYKGIHLKNLFSIQPCLIKQGIKDMASDLFGRDVADRLAWQAELHNELCPSLPLPEILDFFTEGGDTYLVMEFIKGGSLYDRIREINYNFSTWFEISQSHRLTLLNYLVRIVQLVEDFHARGFVHRDLAPGNFLLDRQDRIFMIDVELAYSLKAGKPYPPFQLGTPGFMSPEQLASLCPTFKEDIYGLGGLMVVIFTGFSPDKLDTVEHEELQEHLEFLIGEPEIARLIAQCMHPEPGERPDLAFVQQTLRFYEEQVDRNHRETTAQAQQLDQTRLREVITEGLEGITRPPVPLQENIWYSAMTTPDFSATSGSREFTRYCGLFEGLSGVLHLLAQADRAGWTIEPNFSAYHESWKYVKEQCFAQDNQLQQGFFQGAAGIAVALSSGICSGLLEDSSTHRNMLQQCFALPSDIFNVASGEAGVGIALLQCLPHLQLSFARHRLESICATLLHLQRKDGLWPNADPGTKSMTADPLGFYHGAAGIAWFLLQYGRRFDDPRALTAAQRSITALLKRTRNLQLLFDRRYYHNLNRKHPEGGDVRMGIFLAMLKAYDIFQDSELRISIETTLRAYPAYLNNHNFTQQGMAGLGELYLEAATTFRSNEWITRAEWIAGVLIHSRKKNASSAVFWQVSDGAYPTADFMVGISGVLHFLMRCVKPAEIGCQLWT